MKRKILALILIGLMLPGWQVQPVPLAYAQMSIPISAPSAVLLDNSTSRLVYAKTPNLRRAPASTTKILTAMVALDLMPTNRIVTIPGFVRNIPPSKAYLRKGERYRAGELVRAALISSSNDAAEVLATAAAGSRAGFAAHMNRKIRSLGCERSHFVNPSGLPASGQYATALDMARVMRAAHRYPFIVQAMRTKVWIMRSESGRRIKLVNHNRMLWGHHQEVLGKTGWTRAARHCFVGLINVYDRKVFVSMLGSHRLWKDLKTLIDYQFGASFSRKVQPPVKIWARNRIYQIQAALERAGYQLGGKDGVWGPRTAQAVRSFQSAHGLSSDGIVGPQTWEKLRSYL